MTSTCWNPTVDSESLESVMCEKDLGEFDLIQRMTRQVKIFSGDLRTGIGDDCAVISSGAENDLLLTSDLFVEKIHFDCRWFLPEQIGSKALRASLSDIAAMGGRPEFALVSLAIPKSFMQNETESIYRGIQETAERFQVTLVGGDLSRSAGDVFLDIMILGKVDKDQAVLRSGAQPGDRIFVSGNLGEASLGLRILESGQTGPDTECCIHRQRTPEPRISLGQTLSKGQWASAMIDLSDGLSSDLGHLCKASGVGARIRIKDLPASDAYQKNCAHLSLDDTAYLLHGGEDYELLFTVPPHRVEKFRREKLPLSVTEIGKILPISEGILLELADGQTQELRPGGYDHFRKPS